MDIREILEGINQTDLVKLIIDYSDNGFYPLELFLLKSSYKFNGGELENYWNGLYVAAQRENEKDQDRAVEILASGARLVAEIAKRDLSEQDSKIIYSEVISDLILAAEEDGIGMECDSEWLYLDVAEQLKANL